MSVCLDITVATTVDALKMFLGLASLSLSMKRKVKSYSIMESCSQVGKRSNKRSLKEENLIEKDITIKN